MIIEIKKPKNLWWINDKTWEVLSLKEKDFVILLHKRVSKRYLMRKLHISDNSWLWRLQKRVTKKLKVDIDKINEKRKNIL